MTENERECTGMHGKGVTRMVHDTPVVVILCLSCKLIVNNENLQRKKKDCAPRAQTSRNDSFGPVLLADAAISNPGLVVICLCL